MSEAPTVIMAAGPGPPGWLAFRDPVRVITAETPEGVRSVLDEVDTATAAGLHAVGFVCYEAAAGMDPALVTHARGALPLAWFGLYAAHEPFSLPSPGAVASLPALDWQPDISRDTYGNAVRRIREYLRAGDSYQVNFTFRMRAARPADSFPLFLQMQAAQPTPYAAFIDTSTFAISSASPELCFAHDGDALVSHPMKGTAPRGLTTAEDDELGRALRESVKNRAENVMIVDMIRNDMGRLARPGTVHVPTLYAVERYPTVWQMTSTVESRTQASLADIMGALFPCASITGAPKVHTMALIRELEASPRGLYTGCIGHVAPGGRSWFNVAIRTVVVDKVAGLAEYGVGGGIVWDSNAEDEYRECLTKSAVLALRQPEFSLLETLLWDGPGSFFLLDRHLNRLEASARYFGMPVDLKVLRQRLQATGAALAGQRARVRVTVSRDGVVSVESRPFPPRPADVPWRVAFAPGPVDKHDRFLYHKTTHRVVYEGTRASVEGVDDVLLWNADGEVTESTIANIVVQCGDRKITPPVSSGLLAGVFREELLLTGEIQEAVVTREAMRGAEQIWLINSVRKWIPATLAE